MKKNLKIMITSLVLALSVLASIVPAQAAVEDIYTPDNGWMFKFSDFDNRFPVYVGQTSGVVLNDSIYGNTITWSVDNEKLASIDQYGNITGKKAGKVTVTATDGVHTAKCTITIKSLKKAKKNEVVLSWGQNVCIDRNKYYTVKVLKGGKLSKLSPDSKKRVPVKGNKFKVTDTISDCETEFIRAIVKNGKKKSFKDFSYVLNANKKKQQAIDIIKRDMVKYGVTTESSDLEKAMFVYNWNGDNVNEFFSDDAFRHPGSYHGIIDGYGDCDVHAETVDLICEVIGLWSVDIHTADRTHCYNGIRVDGKWYLMDTMQCESWKFSKEPKVHFLNSYAREMELDPSMAFTSDSKLSDLVFTSTKYDGVIWPEYRSNYEEANPMDPIWDDPNADF